VILTIPKENGGTPGQQQREQERKWRERVEQKLSEERADMKSHRLNTKIG
jgi:hypothetical protein